jgi:hypothetical protein
MLAAVKAVASKAGVLFIVKNYAGDVMNFQMAMDMMEVDYASVLVNDDVALEPGGHGAGRRGIAGTLVVEKIVGAAAERGDDSAACKHLGDQVNARTGLDGRGAFQLHGARGRGRDLRDRPRGNRAGRRHPWRARAAAARPSVPPRPSWRS